MTSATHSTWDQPQTLILIADWQIWNYREVIDTTEIHSYIFAKQPRTCMHECELLFNWTGGPRFIGKSGFIRKSRTVRLHHENMPQSGFVIDQEILHACETGIPWLIASMDSVITCLGFRSQQPVACWVGNYYLNKHVLLHMLGHIPIVQLCYTYSVYTYHQLPYGKIVLYWASL